MKLSVIIVSYKSDHLLENLIKKFPKKYEILIIENSLQKETKIKIEKKFSNTKVIIPSLNLGYASAFNLGFRNSRNNFVLTVTPDVIITKKLISKIEKFLKTFKNFYLLAPEYKNKKIYQNYKPVSNSKNIIKFKDFQLEKAKDIDWCFCIINKKKFKNKNILDQNFFLYFETMDLCKNLFKNKKKMFVVKNLKFDHIGTSSTNKKYKIDISLNRNWHFSWSKFYFFKKHNNYFFALKKILPNIYQGILGILISIIFLNFTHIKQHFFSLMGILNGLLLRRSHHRPNID